MPTPQTVLLVGGTGRTGGRVLRQLLERGVRVRAIVRSRGKLPADLAANPNLTVIEASLLSLRDEELRQHLRGCDAVIQRAADFLLEKIGPGHPFVQWVAVRPDTLLEGEVTEYAVHDGLVDSVFAPGKTNMANVAHFMCELVTNPKTWSDWKGKLPVISNAGSSSATTP